MISEILGLFVNTLTAHDKYSLQNKENLPRQSQMQLSKKQKTFSEFFAPFLRSISNFQHFNKTMDMYSTCDSKNSDCEKRGLTNV